METVIKKIRELEKRYYELDKEAGKYNRPEFDNVYAAIQELVKDIDDVGDRSNLEHPLCVGTVIDEALEKAGFSNDGAFVSDFKKYREIEQQAREIQQERMLLGMGLNESDRQKAGFLKNDAMQARLDNLIAKAKEENPYFPYTAPFASIEKNDETIDDFLHCEKSDIKSCLLGYYKELKRFNIDDLFAKAGYPFKSLFEEISEICSYISESINKPLHLENTIIDILKDLDKYPGFGQVMQVLILKGILKWFEVCNINEGDEGYTQAYELCKSVREKYYRALIFYSKFIDKNENSRPLDNYLATCELYKYLLTTLTNKDANTSDEAKNEPQQLQNNSDSDKKQYQRVNKDKQKTGIQQCVIPSVVVGDLTLNGIIEPNTSKWLKSKALCAYFVQNVFEKADRECISKYKNKYTNNHFRRGERHKIEPFESLFGMKGLSGAINDNKKTESRPIGSDEIEEIIKKHNFILKQKA